MIELKDQMLLKLAPLDFLAVQGPTNVLVLMNCSKIHAFFTTKKQLLSGYWWYHNQENQSGFDLRNI